MADLPVKKSKLSFKGDNKEKKKKRKHKHEHHDKDGLDANQDGWVRADSLDDLVGPVFITHPSDPPICFTVDENDRFIAYPMPEDVVHDEPLIVNQVFVGARLLGTTDRFTFKSYLGKYLGSDKIGAVHCDVEAISGLQEWRPIVTDAGIALQNTYDKFLMLDETANGFKIRADADEIGFCETFRVYCQAKFKYKRKKVAKEKFDANQAEVDNVRKTQSWGGGKMKLTSKDARALERARSEGRLNEAMLDRRAQMKADRYCK